MEEERGREGGRGGPGKGSVFVFLCFLAFLLLSLNLNFFLAVVPPSQASFRMHEEGRRRGHESSPPPRAIGPDSASPPLPVTTDEALFSSAVEQNKTLTSSRKTVLTGLRLHNAA